MRRQRRRLVVDAELHKERAPLRLQFQREVQLLLARHSRHRRRIQQHAQPKLVFGELGCSGRRLGCLSIGRRGGRLRLRLQESDLGLKLSHHLLCRILVDDGLRANLLGLFCVAQRR